MTLLFAHFVVFCPPCVCGAEALCVSRRKSVFIVFLSIAAAGFLLDASPKQKQSRYSPLADYNGEKRPEHEMLFIRAKEL